MKEIYCFESGTLIFIIIIVLIKIVGSAKLSVRHIARNVTKEKDIFVGLRSFQDYYFLLVVTLLSSLLTVQASLFLFSLLLYFIFTFFLDFFRIFLLYFHFFKFILMYYSNYFHLHIFSLLTILSSLVQII